MRLRSSLVSSVCAAAFALTPVVAGGASVTPGQTVEVDGSDFQLPAGEKLAEKTIDFTLNFALPAGGDTANPPPTTTGSLTSSVFRSTTGGGLVFVYDLDLDRETDYADESSVLTVRSFGNFATDVTGVIDAQQGIRVQRSADGSALFGDNPGEGLGGAPVFAVATDATAFDGSGSGSFEAFAEFVVGGPGFPDGAEQMGLGARFDFTGLYQPLADDGGPGPNPIPLPPAAWAALATAGMFGAGARLRRLCRAG
jgi:hypothetical protein